MFQRLAGFALVLFAAAAHAQVQECVALVNLASDSGRIVGAAWVPGPAYSASDGNVYNLPPFCKVSAVSTPTPDSLINIELWLPQQPDWNGRFQGIGNGGYAGSTAAGAPAMAAALKRGFAVATTDMGTAPSATSNADVLVGHPQKWEDWGHRATHLMTVLAKQAVRAYYGQVPVFSYFNGCSTGGQQSLMSAQRYPQDYDGILAGSPAHNRTHVHTAAVWNYRAQRSRPTGLITSAQATAITAAVVAACAVPSGGVAGDAFLTDPRRCDWDPAALQCTGADTGSCLTPDQVAAAREIYAGAVDPRTGARIMPGSIRGSEADTQFGWFAQGRGAEPIYDSLFKWVFGSTWLWPTFDFDAGMASVDQLLAPVLNANSADLSQFAARGGRMILYHGTADPMITPQESINYYSRVMRAQSASAVEGLRRTKTFFRLFMVPGMGHCAGGPGPNAFGNLFSGLVVAAPPPSNAADYDAFTALQLWVEQSIAPDRIVATKYVQDQPALGIQMQRPICTYPAFPRYTGSGDSRLAPSFICAEGSGTAPANPEPAPQYLN